MSNLISLLGAVLSAFLGHYFTIRQFNKRSKKQKNVVYSELSRINKLYIKWLLILIDDFNNPLKKNYQGMPHLSTRLLDNLLIELSSSNEILSEDQTQLVTMLPVVNKTLIEKDNEKDVYIKRHFSEVNDRSETVKIELGITFYTAQQLRQVIELIFYTSKLSEEYDNFIFGDYSQIDMIHAVCKYAEIEFNNEFWNTVNRRLD